MTRINTNVSSLVAQSRLSASNKDLQTALTRLSTGLRINSGSDDPAGLIASEALRSEITSLNKSISNTRRASQIISTADSALGQVSNLLNDIRGLVVEAANSGALSPDEIAANQLQVDSSLEAINRIAQTTTFQGRKLLDGSLDFITTPGTNSTRVENLQINSASLGRTGQVDISINVSQAATQAELEFGDFTVPPPAEAATGSVEFTSVTTPGVQASSGDITLGTSSGVYSISARSTGAFAGAAGNDIEVITAVSASGTASSMVYDENANTLTVTLEEGQTLDDIATLLAANADFEFTSVTSATVDALDTAASADLVDGVDEVSETATIDITAVEGGADFNGTVNVVQTAGTTTPTASFANGALTITINNTGNVTVDSVVQAIAASGDFTAEASGDLTTFDAATGLTITETDLTGGTDIGGAAVAASGTIDFELETTPAVSAASGDITLGTSSGVYSISARATGAFAGAAGNDIEVITAVSASGTASSIVYDENANTLTVTLEEGQTLDDIATLLASNADFEFTSVTSATVDALDTAASADLVDGEDAVTGTGSIEVTADETGEAFNGTIEFVQAAGTTTPTAAFANGVLTVTVNDTGNITLASIATAISGVEGFSATASGAVTQFAGDDASLTVTDTELTGGAAAEVFGVAAAAVFELAGSKGSEVFNVSAGTTLDQLVSQINLVSDATGVSAAADGTDLVLTSTGYGSKSKVELRVLSQGEGGNFGVGGRELGTDIVATVNGRAARGDGNQLAVNTATLNMVADIEAGFAGTTSFTIAGGGANFQLGPEVVTNQQARIGIGSVNAARLGGVAGKLFELGSGEAAALATDPTRAAEIVNEAIAQVTGLRGRLGAFQATSLDSNLVSLSDTVANLQEAESSIRDADFAAESAALTRAQILVQSGTNVLSLANQNPQNVLSLLR